MKKKVTNMSDNHWKSKGKCDAGGQVKSHEQDDTVALAKKKER